MNISVKKLSPHLLDDFLLFFDAIAFADNFDWERCYCVFWHHAGNVDEWMNCSKESNRENAIKLLKDHSLQGFLAYDNEKPIVFCNVNNKNIFTFNKARKEIADTKNNNIVSIVCFVVAHMYRRKGVASLLLKAVIDEYKDTDVEILEAYPSKTAENDSQHYHGPLQLYMKNGFTQSAEFAQYFAVKKILS